MPTLTGPLAIVNSAFLVRRIAIGLATGGLALVLVSPVSAATTIGSPHVASDPNGSATCKPCPQAMLQDTIGGARITAPAGVIVKFRFKGEGSVGLVAYRPSQRSDTHLVATKVGSSALIAGAGQGTVAEGAVRIPVQSGDMVGLSVPSGGLVYGTSLPGESTRAWAAEETSDGTIDSVNLQQAEFFYQADIEPDGDGDGFGDETQDKCKGEAGPNDGCKSPQSGGQPAALKLPALGATSIRASKSGSVGLRLRNPNSYAISGTVTLKQGSKRVGSAKFSLAAGAAKTVSAKLNAATRARLKRAGKLKLKLTISTRGPAGTSPRTTTKTVTIRRA
jgi:hypothetical protein